MSNIESTYAKALFDVALDENTLESVKQELTLFVEAIKLEKDYMRLLKHPKLTNEDKKTLIKNVLGQSESKIVQNFLMVLIDKDRMSSLNGIVLAFNTLVNKHLGLIEGVVYSATALSDDKLETLSTLFSKKLGEKVMLTSVIDESLIGGYKVSVNNVVYDNSIKLQLKHLKDTLMNVELK